MSRFIYSLEKDGYRCVYNYNVCGRWDYPYAINIYQKPSSGSGNPCRRYHEEFKEEMTYQMAKKAVLLRL